MTFQVYVLNMDPQLQCVLEDIHILTQTRLQIIRFARAKSQARGDRYCRYVGYLTTIHRCLRNCIGYGISRFVSYC